jgi:hypothetical protein
MEERNGQTMGLMDGREITEFAELLTTVYDWDGLTRLLLSINQEPVQKLAGINADFAAATLQVVIKSNERGWVADLLIAFATDRSGNPDAQAFLARHPHFDPKWNPHLHDFWQSTRLFGGDLFIGRPKVRTLLKRMTVPENRKVLQITSKKHKVGKSYTCFLVNFVSHYTTLNKVTYVELDKKAFDLARLADHLAEHWGIDPTQLPKQGTEQESRWAQWLAPALVENAMMSDGMVRWLILDGFGASVTSEGIKELVDGLALKIKATANFRLILVDYDPLRPLPLPVRAFAEVVEPLTRREIEETLEFAHLSRFGENPAADKIREYMESYDARLAEYKEKLPEHAESHLVIHHAAADVVEEMQ